MSFHGLTIRLIGPATVSILNLILNSTWSATVSILDLTHSVTWFCYVGVSVLDLSGGVYSQSHAYGFTINLVLLWLRCRSVSRPFRVSILNLTQWTYY